ncbi:BTB/POZ domain-containing protein [Prunus yedoensis var. nudiflora]|nr:BTB/POZ domain-containing protein [Prunus yedoensis var. nudiflora]PQQ05967.1 BTB/POZ domain-containing protein [Prunus yedoensis var. nudiflora]
MDDSRRDRGVLMAEIAREADNMQWIVDILVDKKMGDEFVKLWADQKELAVLHSKIPTMYRHEISRITAQLCIAIGSRQLLVPKETRFSLLSTWLEALYEDFGWMRRASFRSIDKKLVEEGISQTILTLPLQQQQGILLNWFDRFLNKGDDCPNIQKAFEVWWRRAFIKHVSEQENTQLQITLCDYPS